MNQEPSLLFHHPQHIAFLLWSKMLAQAPAFQPTEGKRNKERYVPLPQRTFLEASQDTSAYISFARTYSHDHTKLTDRLEDVVFIPSGYVSRCKARVLLRIRRKMDIGSKLAVSAIDCSDYSSFLVSAGFWRASLLLCSYFSYFVNS